MATILPLPQRIVAALRDADDGSLDYDAALRAAIPPDRFPQYWSQVQPIARLQFGFALKQLGLVPLVERDGRRRLFLPRRLAR